MDTGSSCRELYSDIGTPHFCYMFRSLHSLFLYLYRSTCLSVCLPVCLSVYLSIFCASATHIFCIYVIHAAGANPTAVDIEGKTSMHWTVTNTDSSCVNALHTASPAIVNLR